LICVNVTIARSSIFKRNEEKIMARLPIRAMPIGQAWITRFADNSVALVLDSDKAGPFSFALTPEAIDLLRSNLACAEPLVRRRSGAVAVAAARKILDWPSQIIGWRDRSSPPH
jgi:hypothetical protein